MTKLRDELRGAFDKEQAALGDVGDARHRLVRGALAASDAPASRGLQWAAGIAALLIAAIVIATFTLARANTHSKVLPAATPSSKAQALPTPLTKALSVPDSTPLIIYTDPANQGQFDAITWDGGARGVLPEQHLAGFANPAGSLFGLPDRITDRHGNVIATGIYGAKFFQGTWADDETHFCLMTPFDNPGPNGVPTTLELGAPGEALVALARIGNLYNQTSVSVLACSVLADRAVVVQSGGQGVGTAQYWVVQLSTGKVLWTRSFTADTTPSLIEASRDGGYVAELQPTSAAAGSVVYGADGKVVARLAGWVRGFSWDGSVAVVESADGASSVMTWPAQKVLWSSPAGYKYFRVLPEPGGAAVAILDLYAQGTGLGDLYVVSASGSLTVRIASTWLNF